MTQNQSPGHPLSICLPQSLRAQDNTVPHTVTLVPQCHTLGYTALHIIITTQCSTYHMKDRITTRLHTGSPAVTLVIHTCTASLDHIVSENHLTGLHSHASYTLSHITSSASEICNRRGWGGGLRRGSGRSGEVTNPPENTTCHAYKHNPTVGLTHRGTKQFQ